MENTQKKDQKKGFTLILILLLVFLLVLGVFVSSFVYQVVNVKDYSSIYEEKIERGEIIDPVTKYGLLFQNLDDILEMGREIIVNTILGDKRIVVDEEFPNLNLKEIEKEFIEYAAIQLKLYNLQEIPFTSIRPKIQILIDQRAYSIEISKGEIFVNEGVVNNPDLILNTGYEEIFKMARDEDYISESFSSGKSSIKITGNYLVLVSKGYLNLYRDLENFL